jgi:hypothetical protein
VAGTRVAFDARLALWVAVALPDFLPLSCAAAFSRFFFAFLKFFFALIRSFIAAPAMRSALSSLALPDLAAISLRMASVSLL